jgi:hypothetical protein
MTVTEILAGYYEPDQTGRRTSESLYGATKICEVPPRPWRHRL